MTRYLTPRRAISLAAPILILGTIANGALGFTVGPQDQDATAQTAIVEASVPAIGTAVNDANGHDLAVNAIIAAGYPCLSEVEVYRPELTPEDKAILEAGVRALGPGTGFLTPGGPWARGQAFVGSLPEAVSAFGASLLTDSVQPGPWILASKLGSPVGLELDRVSTSSGRIVWLPGSFVEGAACAAGANQAGPE